MSNNDKSRWYVYDTNIKVWKIDNCWKMRHKFCILKIFKGGKLKLDAQKIHDYNVDVLSNMLSDNNTTQIINKFWYEKNKFITIDIFKQILKSKYFKNSIIEYNKYLYTYKKDLILKKIRNYIKNHSREYIHEYTEGFFPSELRREFLNLFNTTLNDLKKSKKLEEFLNKESADASYDLSQDKTYTTIIAEFDKDDSNYPIDGN
jgi:hypothetical protein